MNEIKLRRTITMKRFVISTLAILLIMTNIIVFADTEKILLNGLEDNIIIPNAQEVCDGYDHHDMMGKGTGIVFIGINPDKSNRAFAGQCWQCTRCTEVVVTQYDPLEAGYVGKYAFDHPGYEVSGNGSSIWTDKIYFTTSSKVPYCKFRWW